MYGDIESTAIGIRTIKLNVKTPFGLKLIKLDNIYLVLGFLFNLVSALKLEKLEY